MIFLEAMIPYASIMSEERNLIRLSLSITFFILDISRDRRSDKTERANSPRTFQTKSYETERYGNISSQRSLLLAPARMLMEITGTTLKLNESDTQ